MEFVAPEVYIFKVGIADLDAGFIGVLVQRGLYSQASVSGDVANQIDHYLPAQQRSPSPVVSDVAEHPVLDLVPFAGARRKVTDLDL